MLPVETEALILRAVNYGEADRIVTLLGRQTGKVSALARGARKSLRRFTGLGSAALGTAALRERGGEVWSFESFQVSKPRTELAADLIVAAHAAYACELVERLCPGNHPEEGVFDWLDQMLDALTVGRAASERLRVFELGLLERIGLAPSLEQCAACGGGDLARKGGRWNPETLMLVCLDCGSRGQSVPGEVLAALHSLARSDPAAASTISLDPSLNRACRSFLTPIIQHHVGGPLKAMTFLSKLSRSVPVLPNAHPPQPPRSSVSVLERCDCDQETPE